ncbi:MAG: acyltransferase [Candidatus Nanopelagicales bacterium]|nr:acyltransferase [Candidatus Nanopelagicales bacterium]
MSRSSRDPRQARFVTIASLRWILRNRAWSWFYLVRYWRLLWFRLRNPHVVLTGLVFLSKGVRIEARPGYGRIIVGRWVHLGECVKLRAHEGTLRIGDKTVIGQYTTVNAYLDIEIGERGLISDWIYIGDFDHVHSDIHLPIKDQGIVKAPVRIGPDCWIGVKATVLRGTVIGHGSVLAANSVAKGEFPPESVIAGVPARVIKDRRLVYEADAQRRRDLADIARKTALAAGAPVELEPAQVDVTDAAAVARR